MLVSIKAHQNRFKSIIALDNEGNIVYSHKRKKQDGKLLPVYVTNEGKETFNRVTKVNIGTKKEPKFEEHENSPLLTPKKVLKQIGSNLPTNFYFELSQSQVINLFRTDDILEAEIIEPLATEAKRIFSRIAQLNETLQGQKMRSLLIQQSAPLHFTVEIDSEFLFCSEIDKNFATKFKLGANSEIDFINAVRYGLSLSINKCFHVDGQNLVFTPNYSSESILKPTPASLLKAGQSSIEIKEQFDLGFLTENEYQAQLEALQN